MVPFPIPDLMQLATALDGLSRVHEGTVGENAPVLFTGQYYLSRFLNDSVFRMRLRSSVPLAKDLLAKITAVTNDFKFENALASYEAYNIVSAYGQFKTALFAELGSFTAYFATPKAGYDINALLEAPANLFPESLLRKVPEAGLDVQETARCLAFELPTATGFHAFRAVEAVMRRYYSAVTNGAAPPKTRSMKVYTRAIRQCGGGDEKVLAHLDHLADLHRNPLAHPEDNLTLDEAVDIVGLARSIISAMLRRVPEPPREPVPNSQLGILAAAFTPGLQTPRETGDVAKIDPDLG